MVPTVSFQSYECLAIALVMRSMNVSSSMSSSKAARTAAGLTTAMAVVATDADLDRVARGASVDGPITLRGGCNTRGTVVPFDPFTTLAFTSLFGFSPPLTLADANNALRE